MYRWKPLNGTNFPNNSGFPDPREDEDGVNIIDPIGSPQLLSDANTCAAWSRRCCDPSQNEWCNTKLMAGGPPYKIAPPWMPVNIALIGDAWDRGLEVGERAEEFLGVWNELRWRHQNDPMYEGLANMFLEEGDQKPDDICQTVIDEETGEEYQLTCLEQMQGKLCGQDNFYECRKGHRTMPPWEDEVPIGDAGWDD